MLGNLLGSLYWKSLLIKVLTLWLTLLYVGRHIWVETLLRRLDVDYLRLAWLALGLVILGLTTEKID